MKKSPPNKPFRISILEILLLMGSIAIVLAAYQSTTMHHSFRASFGSMPADDRALEEWYHQRSDSRDIRVERSDRELHVEYRSRQMKMLPELAPFTDLGYQPTQSMTMQSRTEFPLSRMLLSLLALWLIGFFLRNWRRGKAVADEPKEANREQETIPDATS